MEKYMIFCVRYDAPGAKKYFLLPAEKYYDSETEAQSAVERLSQVEYQYLQKDSDFDWKYELDFDGPYAAVIRIYLDPPSEGDRDYINVVEWYIVPVKEKSDEECFVAYIDRTMSGSGQTLNFIEAHHTFENLSEDTECGVYYDIKNCFGEEIDGGQIDFCSYMPIEDSIWHLIDFHYDQFPKREDFIILKYE